MTPHDPGVPEVLHRVRDHHDVDPTSAEDLLAHDRRPRVALARQVAMYLARELTHETLPTIGKSFGGRNHSTVLHAHKRIRDQLQRDADTFTTVEKLRASLSGAA